MFCVVLMYPTHDVSTIIEIAMCRMFWIQCAQDPCCYVGGPFRFAFSVHHVQGVMIWHEEQYVIVDPVVGVVIIDQFVDAPTHRCAGSCMIDQLQSHAIGHLMLPSSVIRVWVGLCIGTSEYDQSTHLCYLMPLSTQHIIRWTCVVSTNPVLCDTNQDAVPSTVPSLVWFLGVSSCFTL